jgi:hypothetical protein
MLWGTRWKRKASTHPVAVVWPIGWCSVIPVTSTEGSASVAKPVDYFAQFMEMHWTLALLLDTVAPDGEVWISDRAAAEFPRRSYVMGRKENGGTYWSVRKVPD